MKHLYVLAVLVVAASVASANGYGRSYAPAFAAPACGVGGCGQAAAFAPSYQPALAAAPCYQQPVAAPIYAPSYGYSRTVVVRQGGYAGAGLGVGYGVGVGFNRGFGVGSRQVIRQRTVIRGGGFGY